MKILGVGGVIWYSLWLLIVADSPAKDSKITEQERNYIETSLKQTQNPKEDMIIPWKCIAGSKAVWAICIANFCENWGFYTFLTQLPKYLKGKNVNTTLFALINRPNFRHLRLQFKHVRVPNCPPLFGYGLYGTVVRTVGRFLPLPTVLNGDSMPENLEFVGFSRSIRFPYGVRLCFKRSCDSFMSHVCCGYWWICFCRLLVSLHFMLKIN